MTRAEFVRKLLGPWARHNWARRQAIAATVRREQTEGGTTTAMLAELAIA
jgi:hypothetical protein